MAFHNLKQEQKDSILDYKLMVYVCEGSEKQKLDWFEVINIAGLKLTDQELRNAVYTGPWLTHAKSIFSKSNGAAYGLSGRYVKGAPNRQEILETALRWISGGKDRIGIYMSDHQHDDDATELWDYYRRVIEWVKRIFTQYRSEMKGIEWGPLYDKFKDGTFDPVEIEEKSSRLMQDDDVTNRGVFTRTCYQETSVRSIFATLIPLKDAQHTSGRAGYVPAEPSASRRKIRRANTASISLRWMLTTSPLGRRVERRAPTTARCSVGDAIEPKARNRPRSASAWPLKGSGAVNVGFGSAA